MLQQQMPHPMGPPRPHASHDVVPPAMPSSSSSSFATPSIRCGVAVSICPALSSTTPIQDAVRLALVPTPSSQPAGSVSLSDVASSLSGFAFLPLPSESTTPTNALSPLSVDSPLRHGGSVLIASLGMRALLGAEPAPAPRGGPPTLAAVSAPASALVAPSGGPSAEFVTAQCAWATLDPARGPVTAAVVQQGGTEHVIPPGKTIWLCHRASGLYLTLVKAPTAAGGLPQVSLRPFSSSQLSTQCTRWQLSPLAHGPPQAPATPLLRSLPRAAPAEDAATAAALSSLSPAEQEAALCDDIISALAGGPTRFFTRAASGGAAAAVADLAQAAGSYSLSPAAAAVLPPATAAAAARCLPLCSDAAFCSSVAAAATAALPAGCGACWQSLCATVSHWLRSVPLLAASLEAALHAPGGLSLLRVWRATLPAAVRWSRARATLAAALAAGLHARARGPALLALLQRRAERAGDAAARSDCESLWAAAAAPYCAWVAGWAAAGALPLGEGAGEFHVVADPAAGRAAAAGAGTGTGAGGVCAGGGWMDAAYVHRGCGCGRASSDCGPGDCGLSDCGLSDCEQPSVPPFLAAAAPFLLDAGRHRALIARALSTAGLPPLFASGGDAQRAAAEERGAAADAKAAAALSAFARSPVLSLRQPHALVAAAAAAASAARARALRLLLVDLQVEQRLRSARGFFLLAHSDLADEFLRRARAELALPAAEAPPARIAALWGQAVDATSAASDPFRHSYTCALVMEPSATTRGAEGTGAEGGDDAEGKGSPGASSSRKGGSSNDQLRTLDVLCLQLQAPFPLSLIFSSRALSAYSLLHRHLLFIRHTERALSGAFTALQGFRAPRLSRLLAPAAALRHRMASFVSALGGLLTGSAAQRAWEDLRRACTDAAAAAGISGSTTASALRTEVSLTGVPEEHSSSCGVGSLVDAHGAYLDALLRASLLTRPRVLAVAVRLLTYCLLFADNARRLVASVDAPIRPEDAAGPDAAVDWGADYTDDDDARGGRYARGYSFTLAHETGKARALRTATRAEKGETVARHPHFALMVNRFTTAFDERLRAFVALLVSEAATASQAGERAAVDWDDLLARIDFGGFYANELPPH